MGKDGERVGVCGEGGRKGGDVWDGRVRDRYMQVTLMCFLNVKE